MKASYKANENRLGNRIVNLLKNNGLTQKELADKVGCTEAAMSRYINGKRNPKGQVISADKGIGEFPVSFFSNTFTLRLKFCFSVIYTLKIFT